MFKAIKMVLLFSIFSWGFTTVEAIAQSTTDLDDNIIFSGESLQGIERQSIDIDEDFQYTPKLNLTLEKEKESSLDDDVLFEGLIEKSKPNDSPIYIMEKINTNQGEGVNSQGGTIPLTTF